MAANYNKSLLKDYEKLLLETERLSSVVKHQNNIAKELHATINNMANFLAEKDEQIDKLILDRSSTLKVINLLHLLNS